MKRVIIILSILGLLIGLLSTTSCKTSKVVDGGKLQYQSKLNHKPIGKPVKTTCSYYKSDKNYKGKR